MSTFEKREGKRKRKKEEFVGRPIRSALKLITFQACVIVRYYYLARWRGAFVAYQWFDFAWPADIELDTRTNTKRWYLATCFLCISLGPRLSGYPNTNSIRCSSSTGCSEIGRRILESAPRLQRVVAPFKHEYQKEYSISKVAANYWDYTHDWNCGILVFPKGWEFRISLLFRLKCW